MSNSIQSNEELLHELTKDLAEHVNIDSSTSNNEEGTSKVNTNDSQNTNNTEIPEDFEESDAEDQKNLIPDDYVDEEKLKDLELTLSEEEKIVQHKMALDSKNKGNEEFKKENYLESIILYTEGLRICPLKYESDRAVLYANRAASKAKLDRKKDALDDCTKAIELNDKYVKAYLRRSKLYEETEKLDESLADYKKILELDPGNKDAVAAQVRLPPMIEERNEKLKGEMLGKLKELGNVILRPFGLSTDHFKLTQDPNTGGYSVNFSQNQ